MSANPLIAIISQQTYLRISTPRLRKLACWLLQQAEQRHPGMSHLALSIALVDDAGITPVNEQFVGHTGPTDVISFRYDPLPGQPHTGAELVINAQRAREEARRRRLEPARELALYLAHGVLHLTGEDDASPAQRARMQRIQSRWLRQANAAGHLTGLTSLRKRTDKPG
jgi:probable rRNA maturation factor